MKRILLGLLIGFAVWVLSYPYIKPLLPKIPRKVKKILCIENNFRFNNKPKRFDEVQLQVIKYRSSDTLLITFNIPQTGRTYYINVDGSVFDKDNKFLWLLYAQGVLHRVPCNPVYVSPDTLMISDEGSINNVRVISQEPRLVGKNAAVHSVIVHNYNKHPAIPKLLVTYFSPKGNTVWDTLIDSNPEIPPEGDQRILLQVKSSRIDRAETSTVTVVEVDHIRL